MQQNIKSNNVIQEDKQHNIALKWRNHEKIQKEKLDVRPCVGLTTESKSYNYIHGPPQELHQYYVLSSSLPSILVLMDLHNF